MILKIFSSEITKNTFVRINYYTSVAIRHYKKRGCCEGKLVKEFIPLHEEFPSEGKVKEKKFSDNIVSHNLFFSFRKIEVVEEYLEPIL